MKFVISFCLILVSDYSLATDNYYHDEVANTYWEDFAIRAMDSSDNYELYKLRKDLCARIDCGKISIGEATD